MKKKLISLVLSAALVLSMAACGNDDTPVDGSNSTSQSGDDSTPESKSDESSSDTGDSGADSASDTGSEDQGGAASGEPVVIRYGTHWVAGLDPNNTDEVTGEYTMGEAERQASLAALEAIKNELNVEFEFLQYPVDVQSDLMTSVLADNPICDIAIMWGGCESTILAQNVLQQLDDYAYLFEDEEAAWMLDDALYGHNYLLSSAVRFMPRWPLIVNLSMIEKVDALKDENGETIYPMDAFLNGEWTWSYFEDYLSKIQAYYNNVDAPDGVTYDKVKAYETDFRFATLSAMHTNGGGIYTDGVITADSQESIEAVQYIKNLMDKGLLVDCGLYDNGYIPQWCQGNNDFGKGGTVFTENGDWMVGGAGSSLADRGESMGIVPWPRPDDVDFDSETYKQVISVTDSVGILKGVDPEKTELALKAFILYWQTYYKTLGGVDSVAAYKEQEAVNYLAGLKVDITNEKYGDDLIECFKYIGANMRDDFGDMLGLQSDSRWNTILGKSFYGLDGFGAYDVAVAANKSLLENVINETQAILATDEVHDNRAPSISAEDVVLAAGTADVDWASYFTAEDEVDGALDMANGTVEVSEELDLATPGKYEKAVKGTISDAAGNETSKEISVIVYNPDNTEAPVVTAKEELPEIALEADTSGINWKDYIESAVDADGLDVSGNITADLSELDTTTPGSYNVVLTVKDYAGNEGTVTIEVTVKAAE